MAEHSWKVVPLSPGQRLDVRTEDILAGGLYRRCSTYRGGGGYDQFPRLAVKHFGGQSADYANQFVVQLHGCNLDCPYCYVTRAGVWGKPTRVNTSQLVDAYIQSGEPVFHLMGGAPALQLPWWGELLDELFIRTPKAVFHSDLMLTERPYASWLSAIIRPRCLYAIDIKGLTPEDWLANTRKHLNEDMFWTNWRAIEQFGVLAYVTFTGVPHDSVEQFWYLAEKQGIQIDFWRLDAFVIDLIEYDATPHIDDVPWGKTNE